MTKRVCLVLLALVLLVTAALALPTSAASSVLYGDVTGDGDITNRDVAQLQQYLNGWDVNIDETAADTNGDGDITNRDVALLQQYLNGWEVTLGPEVPLAELPPVGYDIDGKGRLLVEYIRQEGDTVVVGLHNTSTKWITQETSFVQYVCTDADGNELELNIPYYGTLYFGMMETIAPSNRKEMRFQLPEGTAKVAFLTPGEKDILWWTQWA